MRRSLSLLAGACLGVALSQFPEYAQQYTQRLAGAVDELQRVVADFDAAAHAGGLTREEALAHYAASPDKFIAGRGAGMRATIVRYDQLDAMLGEIRGATPLERLMLLPDFADTEIGRRTLGDFKPAVPVTPEGFLWGGAGLLIGYLVASTLIEILLLPFRRARFRREVARERARERRRLEREERREERRRARGGQRI